MTLNLVSEHACFGGWVRFYSHESRECRTEMRFSVFVPPQAEQGKVPVLYYLAGLTCTEETFIVKAGAQRVAAELGLMLVAPDTSPRKVRIEGDDANWDFGLGAGFYVDATQAPWSAGYRMYSYVTLELPSLTADAFPIDTGRAAIFGHSMGGHGALTLALRHPEVYRSVSALAPICAPTEVPWGQKAFRGYLGDTPAARATWSSHDACELIRSGRRWTGTALVDQGLADKFLARELRPELLEAACATADATAAAAGSPPAAPLLLLRRRDGYDHSYYFVASMIEEHLRHHARALR
jgi:S-formylglutathione hydrolase